VRTSSTASGLTAGNYASSYVAGTLNITPADQTIQWTDPPDIVYGTPLGATQLDVTVSVPGPGAVAGALSYSPAAGTVLHAGPNQTLMVTAAATTNDKAASLSVSINVAKVTPVLTWANPADITAGTPLSTAQLDASASVAGTFTYTPPAGTVLAAGLMYPASTFLHGKEGYYRPADAAFNGLCTPPPSPAEGPVPRD
jgi:hypothetical protein